MAKATAMAPSNSSSDMTLIIRGALVADVLLLMVMDKLKSVKHYQEPCCCCRQSWEQEEWYGGGDDDET